ncbi:protein RoBo-1-like [Peromyscus californicus insignis]|uniref:protein RoBo-1-like n=1 Tax=Peromyscus californicus insignis TaxID=564181 RepID=UPI0022A7B78D|nr:protein RoBo-1-like [Peromyscus californicus insignis]
MSWSSVLKSLLAVCIFTHLSVSSVDNLFGSLKIMESSCSEDECTELAFSTTLGSQRTFSYDQQCCYTEQCNTESKRNESFPPSQPQPNGVECPACYSEDGKCEPLPLKCTGLETKCVEVFGTALINGPLCSIIRGMGCATETACGLKNLTILENAKIEIFCSSESPPLRSFSSALSCLFLLKALL